MASSSLGLPLLLLSMASLLAQASWAHNITAILDGFPEYSLYNSYLTQTKVCDEINSRQTVTCLVLPNAAMSSLAAKQSIAGIKNALRLLTLLDYFDAKKLHSLPAGATLSTTLYQTTGEAPGNSGFVNITNLRGGKVAFSPAAGGKPSSSADFSKSVKQVPYNLSVLEISGPITFPGLLDAPTAASANLTALLEKAGCKIFAGLISSSGVLKIYQDAMDKGFTLFAPNDDAFKAPGVPNLNTLSSAELVTLLQYHALPSYTPQSSLKMASGPIATMASSGAGKYDLSVVSRGDDVSLDTGLDSSRVASTVLDDTPVCVLTVDNLLLPIELFGNAPAPAPGPVGAAPSLAPSPLAAAPAPAPAAKAPSHRHKSPPAPPTLSPEGSSPADSPAEPSDKADEKAAAVEIGPGGTLAAVVVASWALASIL